MQHRLLKCSLCCDKSFESKLEFAEHLAHVLANLSCPVCDNKWASITHLIEHLNIDDCQPPYSFEYEDDKENPSIKHINLSDSASENNEENVDNDCNINSEHNKDNIDREQTQICFTPSEDALAINEIPELSNVTEVHENGVYIQIYDKTNEPTCLQGQTQELKLVSGDGSIEQFVIMATESDVKLENVDNAVVTKQNSDGTISLRTVKEINQACETETVIAPSEQEAEGAQEELYSCNTCKVSFSSVFDHIQNYHNDQEVVVEEPFDGESRFLNESIAIKQEGTKRVITDTGDIVETTSLGDTLGQMQPSEMSIITTEEETLVEPDEPEKQKRQQSRRYVQIDKFCSSVVRNINPEENSGPYHTVMLKDSMVNGEPVKTYYCMTCTICASDLDEFKNQPCKVPKYRCPRCPVAYENSKSLCAHMKVHKNRSDDMILPHKELYECEVCNTVFQTNKSLKLHKRMHDPIKERPIDPPIRTLDGAEGSPDKYQCDICQKMIPNDYKTIHQNSHKSSDQLNCGICNKKFLSNEYLEMHMSVHNVDKVPVNRTDKTLLYSCLYCDRRFARPHEKVKHERIHTGEKPHSCEICGKSFRVAYCLTLHMRTHTGVRPYACPFCSKRFKAHSVYNHHLLTHSEVRKYKCPFCPKAFKTSVQLAGHRNSHTKPFSCQQCNRPFASLYAVRAHTETHARQNNLKFSCSLCGASYARAFALKDHMKQIHMTNVVSLKDEDGALGEIEIEETEMSQIEDKVLSPEMTELELTTDQL